ncbi:MAG: hypothetical protein ACJASM_002597, partial [Salibacteraceae bacterium]
MKFNVGSKVIIVDDGPGSMEFRVGLTKTGDRVKSFVHSLLQVNDYYVSPDEFFTSFTEEVTIKEGGPTLVRNSYSFLKKRAVDKESNGEILFIGYPLVEEGSLDINSLKSLVQKVIAVFPQLVYIPHRRESEKTLMVLGEVLEVRKLGMPFELYLAENENLPRCLISYFSSILFNTKNMFGKAIQLSHIRLRDYQSPHYDDLDQLYERIESISEELLEYSIKR